MGQVCRHLEHERFLITDWYTAIVKLSGTRQTFAAPTLIGPKTDMHQTAVDPRHFSWLQGGLARLSRLKKCRNVSGQGVLTE